MNTRTHINWTLPTRLALGALLAAILAIAGGALLQGCAASSLSPSKQADIVTATKNSATAQSTVTEARKELEYAERAIVEGSKKAAEANEAMRDSAPGSPEQIQAGKEFDAAMQSTLLARAAKFAAEQRITDATQALIDAEDKKRAAYKEGVQENTAPLAGVANTFWPGIGPVIQWGAGIAAGAWAITKKGRETIGAVAKYQGKKLDAVASALNPREGKGFDLPGAARALLSIPGLVSSDPTAEAKLQAAIDDAWREGKDDLAEQLETVLANQASPVPLALARNAASVAAKSGDRTLADALDSAARDAHARTVQPQPVGAPSIIVPAAVTA